MPGVRLEIESTQDGVSIFVMKELTRNQQTNKQTNEQTNTTANTTTNTTTTTNDRTDDAMANKHSRACLRPVPPILS